MKTLLLIENRMHRLGSSRVVPSMVVLVEFVVMLEVVILAGVYALVFMLAFVSTCMHQSVLTFVPCVVLEFMFV